MINLARLEVSQKKGKNKYNTQISIDFKTNPHWPLVVSEPIVTKLSNNTSPLIIIRGCEETRRQYGNIPRGSFSQ